MKGSFSEESLARFAELAAATLPSDFAEGDSYDFTTCIRPDGSAYGTSGKCRKGTEGVAKVKEAAPKSAAAAQPTSGGRGSRGPVDHGARVAKHQEKYDAAKAAHDASKAALAAHKGRDARSRALKQPLQSKHEANIEKLGAARDRLINAKVAANAAKAKVESKK